MKKLISLLMFSLLAASTVSNAQVSHLVRWKLNAKSNNTYTIPNVSHTQINAVIELWSFVSDDAGNDKDGSPIQLTCGDSAPIKLSTPNTPTATCSTTGDITFKVLGQAAQGELEIDLPS